MYEGKYIKLFEYLNNIPYSITHLTLTFQELEKILGFEKLIPTAFDHIAWLSNNPCNYAHTESWIAAGWKTSQVKLGESVTFSRMDSVLKKDKWDLLKNELLNAKVKYNKENQFIQARVIDWVLEKMDLLEK